MNSLFKKSNRLAYIHIYIASVYYSHFIISSIIKILIKNNNKKYSLHRLKYIKKYIISISSRKDLSDSARSPILSAPVHRSVPIYCKSSSHCKSYSQSVERSALLKTHIKWVIKWGKREETNAKTVSRISFLGLTFDLLPPPRTCLSVSQRRGNGSAPEMNLSSHGSEEQDGHHPAAERNHKPKLPVQPYVL